MPTVEDNITERLETLFKEDEMYKDCFIIEVLKRSNNKLNVYIDCDGELTLRKCTSISKYLEPFIEEHGWMPEKYVIEVSSPGITRPAVYVRQIVKHIGKNIQFIDTEGEKIEGKMLSINDSILDVEFDRVERIKKKKRKYKEVIQYDFNKIKDIKVKISFK